MQGRVSRQHSNLGDEVGQVSLATQLVSDTPCPKWQGLSQKSKPFLGAGAGAPERQTATLFPRAACSPLFLHPSRLPRAPRGSQPFIHLPALWLLTPPTGSPLGYLSQ